MAKIEEIGEGEWITGYGWSEDELDEGRRPLRRSGCSGSEQSGHSDPCRGTAQ